MQYPQKKSAWLGKMDVKLAIFFARRGNEFGCTASCHVSHLSRLMHPYDLTSQYSLKSDQAKHTYVCHKCSYLQNCAYGKNPRTWNAENGGENAYSNLEGEEVSSEESTKWLGSGETPM
jgi:hypothetical protein